MHRSAHRLTWLAMVFGLAGLPACREVTLVEQRCSQIGPGDLVLTEIMANPLGADDGKEWFELYNASNRSHELLGLRVESAKLDGSLVDAFGLTAWTMPVGAYSVLGSMLEEARPPFVDFAYATALRGLSNSGGVLRLVCDQTRVDQVVYPGLQDGVGYGFDGAHFPDAYKNDRDDVWCPASSEYLPGEYGTPGQANQPCALQLSEGTCLDHGELRQIVAPQAGQVVITEVMANPQAVGDSFGEWIEIYSVVDFDLNALGLAKALDQVVPILTTDECQPVPGASYLVLARTQDSVSNGGLPRVDGSFSFSLRNSKGRLLLVAEDVVLDRVTYQKSQAGVSLALDPRFVQADLNDQEGLWCMDDQGPVFGLGDRGSPGATNPSCDVAPAGQCFEGESLRSIRPAQVGQVLISEIMPNPGQVADSVGEWIEVHIKEDVDLNGLGLGKTPDRVLSTLAGADCLSVAAGRQIVFAASADDAHNGGLGQVDYRLGFGLGNSQGSLVLSQAGVVLDQVTYAASQEGRAFELDANFLEPAMNDDSALWCRAEVAYGLGDFGSPGAHNRSCGAAPSGQCWQDSVLRPVRPAAPGQVLITEVMPDPSQVPDGVGEWFEVYGLVAFDLNGLAISRAGSKVYERLDGGACREVPADSYVVFAHQREHNGGLERVDSLFALSLPNAVGGIQVWSGAVLLDSVQWSQSSPGRAFSLDPIHLDELENDNPAHWCTATTTYGAGDLGTPGAENPPCQMAGER